MTYRELLKTCPQLPDRERLLRGIMGWSLGEEILHLDEEAVPEDEVHFLEGVRRLLSHEPLQYILGEAPFYGRSFKVDSAVLIPRFDTEILVEKALSGIDERIREGEEHPSVLDLCTGSGCIAVTLLLERAEIRITASDISKEALTIAEENASGLLGEDQKIRFVNSDLFENINGPFDLIVTNPPYIRTADLRDLDPEVRDHEPGGALDGGEDGLCYVRRIAREASGYLKDHGLLLMEIGDEEGADAIRIFENEGYEDIKVFPDLSGKDRVLSARKGNNV